MRQSMLIAVMALVAFGGLLLIINQPSITGHATADISGSATDINSFVGPDALPSQVTSDLRYKFAECAGKSDRSYFDVASQSCKACPAFPTCSLYNDPAGIYTIYGCRLDLCKAECVYEAGSCVNAPNQFIGVRANYAVPHTYSFDDYANIKRGLDSIVSTCAESGTVQACVDAQVQVLDRQHAGDLRWSIDQRTDASGVFYAFADFLQQCLNTTLADCTCALELKLQPVTRINLSMHGSALSVWIEGTELQRTFDVAGSALSPIPESIEYFSKQFTVSGAKSDQLTILKNPSGDFTFAASPQGTACALDQRYYAFEVNSSRSVYRNKDGFVTYSPLSYRMAIELPQKVGITGFSAVSQPLSESRFLVFFDTNPGLTVRSYEIYFADRAFTDFSTITLIATANISNATSLLGFDMKKVRWNGSLPYEQPVFAYDGGEQELKAGTLYKVSDLGIGRYMYVYENIALAPTQTYHFAVVPVDQTGARPPTASSFAATLADTLEPGLVDTLAVTRDSNGDAILIWDRPQANRDGSIAIKGADESWTYAIYCENPGFGPFDSFRGAAPKKVSLDRRSNALSYTMPKSICPAGSRFAVLASDAYGNPKDRGAGFARIFTALS